MGKKQRVVRVALIALLLAGLGVLAWQMLRAISPEPSYQGKPLSFWLGGYDPRNYKLAHPNGPPPPTFAQAETAIHELGTNAIPTLLRMLQQRDSKVKIWIVAQLQKQHVIKIPYVSTNQNQIALRGFMALGPSASNAVPRLTAIFDRDPSLFPQQAVPAILSFIGPAAGQAVPMLLRGVTHTNEIVRINAIHALGQIHAEPKSVVPVLMRCLNDPAPLVRGQTAHALGAYGKDAQSAVPALLELWRKETPAPAGKLPATSGTIASFSLVTSTKSGVGSPDVAGTTEAALKAIDSEAAAKAGIK